MLIYLDEKYRCHTVDDGTRTAVETNYFYGKCAAYIEGYVFVPPGMSFTDENGITHIGKAAWPWRDSALLNEFQAQYDAQQKTIHEYETALSEIEIALGGER